MSAPAHLACARCGASVPLLVGSHARCLYCLHDNEVPGVVRGALADRDALDRDVERAVAEGTTLAERQERAQVGLAAFILGTLVITGVPTVVGLLAMSGGDPKTLFTVVILAVSWIPFAVIPVAWILLVRRKTDARFAALPLAVPRADGAALGAACPTCGAGLAPAGAAISARCAHCATESLLPITLVQASLRLRHQRAMKARAAATEGMQDAVKTWQRVFVPLILGFNVLMGVAIGLAALVYSLVTG